jgi:hypothetical protein
MKSILLVCAIVFGFVLQGCASVVAPTLAALGAVSPLTADPAGFEIAVDMPHGADIATNGATFALSMARSDTGETFDQEYVLQRRQSTDGRVLFRVNPADLDDIRAFQAKAITWEAEDPVASSGSFGVGVTACSTGDGPAPDARFSLAIRTEVDGSFMPLIRNALVSDVLGAVEALEDAAETAPATLCE